MNTIIMEYMPAFQGSPVCLVVGPADTAVHFTCHIVQVYIESRRTAINLEQAYAYFLICYLVSCYFKKKFLVFWMCQLCFFE